MSECVGDQCGREGLSGETAAYVALTSAACVLLVWLVSRRQRAYQSKISVGHVHGDGCECRLQDGTVDDGRPCAFFSSPVVAAIILSAVLLFAYLITLINEFSLNPVINQAGPYEIHRNVPWISEDVGFFLFLIFMFFLLLFMHSSLSFSTRATLAKVIFHHRYIGTITWSDVVFFLFYGGLNGYFFAYGSIHIIAQRSFCS